MNNVLKKNKYKVLGIFLIMAYALALNLFTPFDIVLATDASDAWEKAGIDESGSLEDSDIYEDLSGIVYFLMVIGGIWVIAWLIIGGMLLAGSNGNPQRRTAGLVSLVTSAAGGYVIYKAYDIAGYIAGFGS